MRRTILVALPAALAAVAWAGPASAAPSLDDYRHFRALSIDLMGRVPTRAELAAFEKNGFDLDAWVGQQLKGPGYVARLQRIYMDLLRLQVGSSFQFVPQASRLRRATITGPNGKDMYVYYRRNQRRKDMNSDGDFCLTPGQTGLAFPSSGAPQGTAKAVTQAELDAATVVVKPWWLYADYKSASPTDLYSASTWSTSHPGFVPIASLLTEPDGMTATTQIRVCKEEAQTADTGTFFAPGNPAKTYPDGRLVPLPTDNGYAKAHVGQPVSCTMDLGGAQAADCGCGVGLERCLPGDSPNFDPASFNFTSNQPIGLDEPTDATNQAGSSWHRVWWGEEASQFLGYVFGQDRDFREVLTGRYTLVNGPLAQFYKDAAPNTCCGAGVNFGLVSPDPLLDPAALPSLLPHDTTTWKLVQDRGPHASGILTMPVFLTKFGSRRARAHVLYNAFKCKDFIAGNIQLKPSTEPNLMIRDGCSTCHATLEPMANYFSRILENDWTYLPADKFPVLNPTCLGTTSKPPPSSCTNYYDPAFATSAHGTLRGAYPDTFANGTYGPPATHHADDGPAGLADELVSDPEFPGCVAQNVAAALLGRQLTADDSGFKQALTTTFVQGGYKMSALVQAIVTSNHYKGANNLTSAAWRKEMGQ